MTTSEDKDAVVLPEEGAAVGGSLSEPQGPTADALTADAMPTGPDGVEEGLDVDEEPPEMITLDRYLSRRRPRVQMGWSQALSLLMMFSGLILILVYKDGCGERVSGLMHAVAPGADSANDAPVVRYNLAPAPAKSGEDAVPRKHDAAEPGPTSGPVR